MIRGSTEVPSLAGLTLGSSNLVRGSVVTSRDESTIPHTFMNSSQNSREVEDSPEKKSPRCVLEDFVPCRESHLWKLMMSFYDRKGPESWSQGIVPHFITCNAFIGRSYAKVLHGFIKDCLAPGAQMAIDTNETLYIIELGAGSGKFSFYMLKALEELQAVSEFPLRKFVYVMTDFTEANFKFWRQQPSLAPYFERGILDAAIFDAVSDTEIKLWRSGEVLKPHSVKNPLCIVANYLFDTLYHDIFQVQGGTLMEGLISVGSKAESEPDPLEPSIIQRLDNHYQYNPISADYYKNEDGDEGVLRRILGWYENYFSKSAYPSGASMLIPIGTFRALRRLALFSSGRALVLSGDKGNNNPEQFIGLMNPHIAVHGSFSLMVNYHAIGAWFTAKGGFALHNPQQEASLKCSCFVLDTKTFETSFDRVHDSAWTQPASLTTRDTERAALYPHLSQAFSAYIDEFGPNDFFVLQKSLKEDCNNLPLRTVIALLKLSDWDPDVFFKFKETILNQAPTCGNLLRNDLVRGVPRVWTNYYMMDLDKDIAFEIGRLYYGIRDYANALAFYVESTRTIGEHHVTFHNQGLCHYSMGNLKVSLDLFKKALSLNAEYEKARSWIDKVEKELNPMIPAAAPLAAGAGIPAPEGSVRGEPESMKDGERNL